LGRPDAVAAAGLCDSFVDVAELFGFVLSSGGPVAAGILLGKRRLRQANGVFTLSLLLTLAGGLLCWCLLPFCGFFSGVLSNNGAIANDVARYAFFTLLSSPFVGVNLVLSSFAILDDRSKLAMGSVVAANGVNIVLDVVFMKYLRMGVAGAAAASLLGNAAGILVVLPYLLSKKRTFRFVLRADDLRETGRELASSCSSFATDKASRIFSGLTVNLLLMYFVGNIGVALYAVYSQLRFILRILAAARCRRSPRSAVCSTANATSTGCGRCSPSCPNTPMRSSRRSWRDCSASPRRFSTPTASPQSRTPCSRSASCCSVCPSSGSTTCSPGSIPAFSGSACPCFC